MKLHKLITLAGLLSLAQVPGSAQVLNPANGHYYQIVDGSFTWEAANAAAAGACFMGRQGHLATITSAEENLFLTSTFGASGLESHWLGGIQPPGSTEPAGGWAWVTGEPFSYANWWPGEPNNFGNEDRIIWQHGVTADGKAWNDLAGPAVAIGFVVEYDNLTTSNQVVWTGYQNSVMNPFPDTGSFFHGDNWLNYVPPDASQTAVFGVNTPMPNGNYAHNPHQLFFGNFGVANPAPGGPFVVPGGIAQIGALHIQDGRWVFDMGSGAHSGVPLPPATNGACEVLACVGIGARDPNSGVPGNAVLVVTNGLFRQSTGGTAPGVVLGADNASIGELAIEGLAARALVAGRTWVGNGGGEGRLTILGGGQFQGGGVSTGPYFGPGGEWPRSAITVSGTGSLLETMGALERGSLLVDDGGRVSSGSAGGRTAAFLATLNGAEATATIREPGSRWDEIAKLTVGGKPDMDTTAHGMLNILRGGVVDSEQGSIANRSLSRGEVVVSGSGSLWTNAGWLAVGEGGAGSLTIRDGASVDVGWSDIGIWGNSRGDLLVEEAGAAFISHGNLFLGRMTNAEGALTVRGMGAIVAATNELWVGVEGRGSFRVENGAQATGGNLVVAVEPGGEGNVAVSGPGALLSTSDDARVGHQGFGSMSVAQGGNLQVPGLRIGHESTGDGTLLVNGGNATCGWLTVGHYGSAIVTITNEGIIFSQGSSIADYPGSQGAVLVNGSGSLWTNAGWMGVGDNGPGTIRIENGARIASGSCTVGNQTNGVGEVVVTGAGSRVDNAGDVVLGDAGNGTLRIENGASGNSDQLFVGNDNGATGNGGSGAMLVNGVGSSWTNWGIGTGIGWYGTGSLVIADGGRFVNRHGISVVWVGLQTNSQGAIRVTGDGSLFQGRSASFGATSSMVVDGRGRAAFSSIRFYGNSESAHSLVVTGAQSAVSSSGYIYAPYDTDGQTRIRITAGGALSCVQGRIGFGTNSTCVLTISGANTLFAVTNLLVLGGRDASDSGGRATLTVTDQALINAGTNLLVWSQSLVDIQPAGRVVVGFTDAASAAPGTVTVGLGGRLTGNGTVAGNVSIAGGLLSPGLGSALGGLTVSNTVLLGGTTLMELNRTNAIRSDAVAAAAVQFGGLLEVRNLGPALQAGDTFTLFSAASYSGVFSDFNLPLLDSGLVWNLSRMAVDGTIRVDAGSLAPAIDTPALSGGSLQMPVPSLLGYEYVLEQSTALSPMALWIPVATNQGTGAPLQFFVPVSTQSPGAFFRVVVRP